MSQIARALKMTRKSVLKWIDKALQMGAQVGRKDAPHKPREAVITDDAKAWVVHLACSKDLDAYYPPACTIRLILDNHSSHICKETRAFPATRPYRFKYGLTPAHGSWLNIVETLFGKMTRTFLRGIRVQSRAELKERILLESPKSTRCRWFTAGPRSRRWKPLRRGANNIDMF